jgi:RimJ/RimL family protein N-acetyltransferase
MKLVFFSDNHQEDLNSFSLVEEQHQFTALPSEALEIKDENRFPIVISDNGRAVGFFILHKGEAIKEYTANSNALLLRAFSVNRIHQGKGFAKEAMNLLPSFILRHFPETDEIVLAVNEKNLAARSLYLKSGFKDHGKKLMGKKGWQSILTYKVKTKR